MAVPQELPVPFQDVVVDDDEVGVRDRGPVGDADREVLSTSHFVISLSQLSFKVAGQTMIPLLSPRWLMRPIAWIVLPRPGLSAISVSSRSAA
jgi:hypothetical protein